MEESRNMLFQLALFTDATGPMVTFETVMGSVLKILFIVGALMYLLFAFVVVRQIQVMKSTLVTPLTPAIQFLGFIHLLFALAVLFLFVTTL